MSLQLQNYKDVIVLCLKYFFVKYQVYTLYVASKCVKNIYLQLCVTFFCIYFVNTCCIFFIITHILKSCKKEDAFRKQNFVTTKFIQENYNILVA